MQYLKRIMISSISFLGAFLVPRVIRFTEVINYRDIGQPGGKVSIGQETHLYYSVLFPFSTSEWSAMTQDLFQFF